MDFKYDKDKLKNELTLEQVFDLVAELGGEPRMGNDGAHFVSKTICHNADGQGSHKLYYYENSHLFRCFTECSPEVFDIFELVKKVHSHKNAEWTLPHAIHYVANFFGYAIQEENFQNERSKLQDWQILGKYNKISSLSKQEKARVEMKFYAPEILTYLPCPHIEPWEKEGITYSVMRARGIKFNPSTYGIIIPHYDENNNLIGIRERTLIKEEEQYGKYKPAILNGKMFNHPLGFTLYNLNNSKENIKKMQKAIVFEGEKSALLFASYFGIDSDISVAVCGSSFTSHQFELLMSYGAKEIVIAFDKQFQQLGDDEHKRWCAKLREINKKYSSKCQISFLFDKQELLEYKMSPIDNGPDTFIELFNNRIILK